MADTARAPGDGVGDHVLRVISHPIRIEILRLLHNRVVSPKEAAKELGESLSNVAYHFKYLRLEGCIEIVDTEPRRGAVEHYYRVTPVLPYDEKSWPELAEAVRTEISGVEIRNLLGEAVRALNAASFDARTDRRLEWMPMELDEQGWRELTEHQAEWAKELERIKAEAAERLAKKEATGRRAVAGVLGFETPSGPGFTDTRFA